MNVRSIGRQIKENTRIEFRLFFVSISFRIFIAVYLILMGLFVISALQYSRLGNAMTTSGILTQSLITVGIVLGAVQASNERKSDCEEVLSSIQWVPLYKTIAKLLLIFFIGLFIFLISSGIVNSIFVACHASNIYYAPNVAYILLYWMLPFMTAGILGCFFGKIIRTKMVYPIVIFVSVLLGPCVPEIVGSIMLSGRGKLYGYLMMFNIGQLDVHSQMSESYGYCLNVELWIARLCILMGATALLAFSTIIKIQKGKLVKLIVLIVICVLFFFGFYEANMILNDQFTHNRTTQLSNYLRDEAEPDPEKIKGQSLNYNIDGYSVLVDDGLSFDILCDIELEFVKDNYSEAPSQIVFTLYRGFEVTSCNLDGKSHSYEQKGDELIIKDISEVILNTGEDSEQHILSLAYKGLPPGNLYSASDKWVLPGMFAWIPVEYIGKAMSGNSSQFSPFKYPDDKKDIPIKIDYEGNNKVFCSLTESGNNTWEGISSGVTVCCGWFDEKEEHGIRVVYPALYDDNPKQAADLMGELKCLIPIMSEELLGERKGVEANKIFIFPSILFDGTGEDVYMFKDHVVVCLYYDSGGFLIRQMDGAAAVMSVVKKGGWYNCDPEMLYMFRYTYMKSLYNRGKYKGEWNNGAWDTYIDRYIDSLETYLKRHELAEIMRKISYVVENDNEDSQIRLLRRFNSLVTEGMSETDIIGMLSEYFEEDIS